MSSPWTGSFSLRPSTYIHVCVCWCGLKKYVYIYLFIFFTYLLKSLNPKRVAESLLSMIRYAVFLSGVFPKPKADPPNRICTAQKNGSRTRVAGLTCISLHQALVWQVLLLGELFAGAPIIGCGVTPSAFVRRCFGGLTSCTSMQLEKKIGMRKLKN